MNKYVNELTEDEIKYIIAEFYNEVVSSFDEKNLDEIRISDITISKERNYILAYTTNDSNIRCELSDFDSYFSCDKGDYRENNLCFKNIWTRYMTKMFGEEYLDDYYKYLDNTFEL